MTFFHFQKNVLNDVMKIASNVCLIHNIVRAHEPVNHMNTPTMTIIKP